MGPPLRRVAPPQLGRVLELLFATPLRALAVVTGSGAAPGGAGVLLRRRDGPTPPPAAAATPGGPNAGGPADGQAAEGVIPEDPYAALLALADSLAPADGGAAAAGGGPADGGQLARGGTRLAWLAVQEGAWALVEAKLRTPVGWQVVPHRCPGAVRRRCARAAKHAGFWPARSVHVGVSLPFPARCPRPRSWEGPRTRCQH